ncbi:flavin reductase family protein [Streptomyces sp. DSM 42041]|uniref:Flavin reductase family protein n=1 Tax=Streptomyces hazeniae TaxID=3075538 RepID=A0ABU2NU86_9ACTN|nr:flavin reductase family protein [Streptomyces sp. DSM 42041]MDT0380549.1 flavin reductase family protein [Streptomyces sp. DSM 42041]
MSDLTTAVPPREARQTPAPPDVRPPEDADCLEMYAKLSSGVCVVAACGDDGPHGMTVSTATSLSAHPPLLLVCLRSGSRTLTAVGVHRTFAVNVLRREQVRRATVFADPRTTRAQRFAGSETRTVCGAPVFPDALAWAACLVEEIHEYGDHHLVVGRVRDVHTSPGEPLLWHDRDFRVLDGVGAACESG